MSENITFNLPITISRERFDAIVKEAARKIYTDGLFDPTDALAPAVAEAVQKQMGAPPPPPPGVIQAGADPSPRPESAQADKRSGPGDPGRPIPPYAWGNLHAYVRARSVPTAALLSQKASIDRWTSDGIVVFKMAKPFAKQFETQPVKQELLWSAVRSVFGQDARWAVEYDAPEPLPIPTPQTKAPVDADFLSLINLMNTGRWDWVEASQETREFAQLWVEKGDGSGHRTSAFYMFRCYPDYLFLRHRSKTVSRILGKQPHNTLRRWLDQGILADCRRPKDKSPSFSSKVGMYGRDVYLSRISIAKLREMGLSVNLFKFPEANT